MNSPNDALLARLDGDTPNLRLFALLEVIAGKDRPFTLQAIAEETGLPKPTTHRMLAQLESAGILQRDGNGRHYSTGQRLIRLAETLLLNSTTQGARHAVLRQLVEEIGESCNLTAFSGGEVLYLDRVETAAPLRFYLHSGSRVPVHCSATGKLFLSEMPPRSADGCSMRCHWKRSRPIRSPMLRPWSAKLNTSVRKATRLITRNSCRASCALACWCPPPADALTWASRCRRLSCDSQKSGPCPFCPHCARPR